MMNAKKEMTSSMRKTSLIWMIVLTGVCLILLIPAIWCGQALKPFLPTTAPDSLPDAEIVYRGTGDIGFVNADGTGVITVPLVLSFVDTWQNPLMTGDGKTIFVTAAATPGYQGNIFAVPTGEKPVDCEWGGIIRISADGSHILLDTGAAIHKFLPEDCGTGNSAKKVYIGVHGALSPDERYVAEVRGGEMGVEEYIVIRQLETGEERNLGNGDFPVWSRDGQWLAYTGVDGIYLLQNGPKEEPSRLIPLESSQPEDVPVYKEYRPDEYYPPIASWSPDGKWLVYHMYSKSLAPNAEGRAGHYSIFKVNVKTGETTKLLDGGYSPSWRWRVENP